MKRVFFLLLASLFLTIFQLVSCLPTKKFEDNITGITSKTGPSLASRSDGIHMAICDESGNIRITRSLRPGNWTAPISILAGMSPITENVLLNHEDHLYLFARTNDNKLAYSKNSESANWSPAIILNNEPDVTGEITVCITKTHNQEILYHIAYVTSNGVYYKLYNGGQMIRAFFLEGYQGCQLTAKGDEEIALSVIKDNQLMFFKAGRNDWNLGFIGVRNVGNDISIGNVISQSNMIYFNKKYHIALCYTRRGPENGFTYTYNIEHLQFGTAATDAVIIKNIAYSWSFEKVFIKPTLSLYRNKMIAVWSKNAAGNIGIARWDYFDPSSPWLAETKLQLHGTTHTIAAATFNKLTNPTVSYLNDYGNDLFISTVNEQGVISFENFSRSLSKALCNEQFQMSTADAAGAQPVEIDLMQDKGPVISELGYNLFIFPDWFINNFYKRMIDDFCFNGIWAPCNLRKFPAIVMPSGGVFFNGGIWVSRQSDYLQIFEELGHYMAIYMGIGNASAGPDQQDADNVRIPLTELQSAYRIFTENRANCSGCNDGRRCLGFTGIACNYDAGGREHSFIYTLYFYIARGGEIRQFIQEDLSRSNDLLKRKYEWVKKNIFNGIEFKNDQEPL